MHFVVYDAVSNMEKMQHQHLSRLFQTCVTPLWVKVQRCKIKSPSPDFLNLTRWSDDAYTNLLFNQSSYDQKLVFANAQQYFRFEVAVKDDNK